MRVISIGDLVTDYYYKDGKFLGVCGGMTSHNIIANLSKMGINTSVFGVCGNDEAGTTAIKSLEDLKVDTSEIVVLDNINTRCFHVSYSMDETGKLELSSRKKCPVCGKKKWYDESLIDCKKIIKKIQKEDIIVFDNLNNKNQEIIDSISNIKIIDLGQYFEFDNMDDKEIVKRIKGKFDYINFNERVSNYFIKRFKLKDDLNLFKLFNLKLMTVTRGEKGALFIYNNEEFKFKLESNSEVVDSTGAGDAFVSSIIKDWLGNKLNIDSNLFEKWYKNSVKLTSKVVKKMGARGHLQKLYKVKKVDDNCPSEIFVLQQRKQIKRCNININNLETRIKNALSSNALDKIQKMNYDASKSYLFIGTGGSYAGAYFSSIIINHLFGCSTYALYPRDVLYRNNTNVDKVLLFSYSGTTNDVIVSSSIFDNDKKYIITKGEVKKIVLKSNIKKDNIISYRTVSNKSSERGFLSFEGALAPASIFLKYYYSIVEPKFDVEKFINSSFEYWHKKFSSLFEEEKTKNMFKKGYILNIFRGDYTNSACYDLESKIIESGIFNCIIHEKKNFSHGRFINYENLENNTSIYLKQKSTGTYEEKLLDYLDKKNTLLLESKYDGLLSEFDLLVASQLLLYYVGILLNIDVSKPKYSENAMKIYFYKGDI